MILRPPKLVILLLSQLLKHCPAWITLHFKTWHTRHTHPTKTTPSLLETLNPHLHGKLSQHLCKPTWKNLPITRLSESTHVDHMFVFCTMTTHRSYLFKAVPTLSQCIAHVCLLHPHILECCPMPLPCF